MPKRICAKPSGWAAADRAWLNLGKVQAKARQYGMAFQSFLETLDTAHAYNEVGEAAVRNGDHKVAKAYFENATNESPTYFEQAYKNLAIANEELKKAAASYARDPDFCTDYDDRCGSVIGSARSCGAESLAIGSEPV